MQSAYGDPSAIRIPKPRARATKPTGEQQQQQQQVCFSLCLRLVAAFFLFHPRASLLALALLLYIPNGHIKAIFCKLRCCCCCWRVLSQTQERDKSPKRTTTLSKAPIWGVLSLSLSSFLAPAGFFSANSKLTFRPRSKL